MIINKRLTSFSIAAVLILLVAMSATAQQPPTQYKPLYPSQKASVMQTIGVTDVTISYSRPAIKGRTIFAEAPPSRGSRARGAPTLENKNERKPGEPIVPYNH